MKNNQIIIVLMGCSLIHASTVAQIDELRDENENYAEQQEEGLTSLQDENLKGDDDNEKESSKTLQEEIASEDAAVQTPQPVLHPVNIYLAQAESIKKKQQQQAQEYDVINHKVETIEDELGKHKQALKQSIKDVEEKNSRSLI